MKIHTYDVLILETHLDTFGHVNNATYLQLMEEALWYMITTRGYGLAECGLGPTILEIDLKFKKEIKLREQIRIETKTLSYEKKIARLQHDLINADGAVCCTAIFVFALFDTKARKLVMPTPEWLHAVGM